MKKRGDDVVVWPTRISQVLVCVTNQGEGGDMRFDHLIHPRAKDLVKVFQRLLSFREDRLGIGEIVGTGCGKIRLRGWDRQQHQQQMSN